MTTRINPDFHGPTLGHRTSTASSRQEATPAVNAPRPAAGASIDESMEYICEMLAELRKLSMAAKAPMVTYLLEMALLEANTFLVVADLGTQLDDVPQKRRP